MTQGVRDNAFTRLLTTATKVESHELKATALSFLFVFVLMTAYFILRPVRDALSSDWTDVQLSWLWTSTFVFSAIAVSIYGGLISRLRFKVIVPTVYAIFAATFVGFYVAGTTLGDGNKTIEQLTKDVLRPLLKEWLDTYLPETVERIVREESARVVEKSQ